MSNTQETLEPLTTATMVGEWADGGALSFVRLYEWKHGAAVIERGNKRVVVLPGERQALARALYIDAAGEEHDD